jgi:DNA-binding PadR family transcriptional regulator
MVKTPLTVPVYQVLLSLSDRDLHGYAIIQDISSRTGGEVELTASTLYAAVKRMLGAGLIEELEDRPAPELDDSRRRYYAITDDGRAVLRAEAERLERSAQMAREKRILPALAGADRKGRD